MGLPNMADMYPYAHPAQGFMPQHIMQMGQGFAPYLQPEVPFRDLRPEDVSLEIRQQPVEALIAIDGKEKARKPLDPAPIIELKVQGKADPPKYFLQSPYLFVCVTLVEEDKDEVVKTNDNKCALVGSVVSSLHRIKDNNNNDGGFFVWGDISCRVLGKYRLKFSLFDFRVRGDNRSAVYLSAIFSEPFVVVAAKDFSGMKESSLLSRTFQSQGIRLRLRKEPRASAYRNSSPTNPKKRAFEEDEDEETSGGAVQRPAPVQQRNRSVPQSVVHYAAVSAATAAAAHQQQATAVTGPYLAVGAAPSAQSTPPPMYSHSPQGFTISGHSPQGYVGNTPSPSYIAATLANSPMMPAYTSGPYTTAALSSGAIPATAMSSAVFSSAGYSTAVLTSAGLATAGMAGGQLAYTSVPYPPYPALTLGDGSMGDAQLSVQLPNSSMTTMFTEENPDQAWTTNTHSNVMGLPNDFSSGDYNGPLNLDLSGMGN